MLKGKGIIKIRIKTVVFVLVLFAMFMFMMTLTGRTEAKDVQKGIAEKIIRFHVLANSDTVEDQTLKLALKDAVVEKMKVVLKDAHNLSDARKKIKSNLLDIESFSQCFIYEQGYSYPVHAELTECYFPVKIYGDLTFPAGEYEALRITIGKAEGKNWWCVMYPRLCFVDSLYTVVPEESKKELKATLTDEEYRQILYGGDKKIKVKLKIWEWFTNWKK